jgi:hypothetical protein
VHRSQCRADDTRLDSGFGVVILAGLRKEGTHSKLALVGESAEAPSHRFGCSPDPSCPWGQVRCANVGESVVQDDAQQ